MNEDLRMSDKNILATHRSWAANFVADPGNSSFEAIYNLATEQRADLRTAWDRVERRTEIVFGLAVAAVGWSSTHTAELNVTRNEIFWCSIPFGLAALACIVAWWKSDSPMSALLKPLMDQANEGKDANTVIAAHTFVMGEMMRDRLKKKQFFNKMAAILILIGVSCVVVSAVN